MRDEQAEIINLLSSQIARRLSSYNAAFRGLHSGNQDDIEAGMASLKSSVADLRNIRQRLESIFADLPEGEV